MRIENIVKYAEDIPVTAASTSSTTPNTTPGPSIVGPRQFKNEEHRERIQQNIREMVLGSINEKQTLEILDELFDDTLEKDSWMNSY